MSDFKWKHFQIEIILEYVRLVLKVWDQLP